MMTAFETVFGRTVAAGGTITPVTVLAGQSLRVRDAKSAFLVDLITHRQASGAYRLNSSLLHDAQIGINGIAPIGIKYGHAVKMDSLTPQDDLSLAGSGSAVAGDVEYNGIFVGYDGLAGIDGRFVSCLEAQRAVESHTFFIDLTPNPLGNDYGVEIPINTITDRFKANQDYAIVGIDVVASGAVAVSVRSSDWGNLRIAAPVTSSTAAFRDGGYFDWISRLSGNLRCIPVFNASQKESVLVSILTNETLVAGVVSTSIRTVRFDGRVSKGGKGKQVRAEYVV